MAPKNLDAIIAVAPVVNTYDDWHFGGVPNGEQTASPLSYQAVYGASPAGSSVLDKVVNAGNGFCDPTLAARASDPRGIYDDFYKERDFAARAGRVKAAVMYTHGYEDSNVKIAVADEFFNDLDVPKLGSSATGTTSGPRARRRGPLPRLGRPVREGKEHRSCEAAERDRREQPRILGEPGTGKSHLGIGLRQTL